MNRVDKYVKKVKEKMEIERKLRTRFLKENRKKLLFFDILFVLSIVIYLSSIMITNALVFKTAQKEGKKVILAENNPIAADAFQYLKSEKNYFSMITIMVAWAFLISGYTILRFTTFLNTSIKHLGFYIVMFFSLIVYDFSNNFGYLIGKILWGGR